MEEHLDEASGLNAEAPIITKARDLTAFGAGRRVVDPRGYRECAGLQTSRTASRCVIANAVEAKASIVLSRQPGGVACQLEIETVPARIDGRGLGARLIQLPMRARIRRNLRGDGCGSE